MRALFVSFIFAFLQLTMQAQKPVLEHIAVHVTDLEKSTAFYREVMGLDTLPEPFHDGKHAWFSIGNGIQLHLIAIAPRKPELSKQNHLCFTVSSLPSFITRLEKAGIPYEDLAGKKGAVTTRPDGILQIYFTDPDGRWIEVNDAAGKK